MAILLKKMVASKLFAPSVLSLMAVGTFKLIGSDNHPSDKEEKSRIIEIDYFRYRNSIGKSLLNGVYSFTDVVFPLSPTKKLQLSLNWMDSGDDGYPRWHVKESADNLCIVRHMSAKTEGEADISVTLDMDGEPKDLGYKADLSIFRWPRMWHVLYNPSATLLIKRKSDESFVSVKLPAGLFHTNATAIETTEYGDVKITLKKLKARRIRLLCGTLHKINSSC